MKCIYHNSDMDGFCSAAILASVFPDIELIGAGYKELPDLSTIRQGERVFMVDYSLQPFEKMLELNKRCDLVWIDHHKTAMEAYEKSGAAIKGLRRDGIGACALVWEHAMGDINAPIAVRLIAQYDVFDHSNKKTRPFQYGLRATRETNNPKSGIWKGLLNHDTSETSAFSIIYNKGLHIWDYVTESDQGAAKAMAFEMTFEGKRMIAMNRSETGSLQFDSVWNSKKYDAMCIFTFHKNGWNVSLFTPPDSSVDVSPIAVKYGGGGHAGACGFFCKELPFELPK